MIGVGDWRIASRGVVGPSVRSGQVRALRVGTSAHDRWVQSLAFTPHRLEVMSDDLEVGHHHVLVFEVVAVEDVLAAVTVESDEEVGSSTVVEINGVFPALVVTAGIVFTVASDDLERGEVDVEGMLDVLSANRPLLVVPTGTSRRSCRRRAVRH